MVHCIALNCKSRGGKAFFRFPKDPEARRKWELCTRRENFKATNDQRLCEDHFEEWCFAKNRKEAKKAGFLLVGLVPEAYPTIFDFTPVKKPKKLGIKLRRRGNKVKANKDAAGSSVLSRQSRSKNLKKEMADGATRGTPTGQSLRPRRTERAHRGKPDFYSPSDYENPFKRQRKRTSSTEAEIVKKKGRTRNSLKTLKFDGTKQEHKNEDDSSRDNDDGSTDSSRRSIGDERQPESPIPHRLEREKRDVKTVTTKARIINTGGAGNRTAKQHQTSVHKPQKSQLNNLCSDASHSKSKEITLMKDVKCKDKDGGKEGSKEGSSAKQTDLYSSLTSEKSLQYAIILAEINRKFMCQNFKPP